METKLKALNAELELIKEGYNIIYDEKVSKLDSILNKYIISCSDAICTRRFFREGFNQGIEIIFELGFHNAEENRIDFASDIWAEFCSDTSELKINYGTCGSYSKSDIYQVKRVKLIAYIWDHIKEIEEQLTKYSEELKPVVNKYWNDVYEIEKEIRTIESKIKEEELLNIESSLVVNRIIEYAENCSLHTYQRHFSGRCKIIKVTPKFVTLLNKFEQEYRVRKDKIINHIHNGHINVISEDTE